MSYSPTTPLKSPSLSNKVYACPGSNATRHNGGPFPSPASTMTETPSQPVTPLDGMALNTRLGQTTQHNVMLPSIDEVVTIDYGSPLQTRKILYRSGANERVATANGRSITTRLPGDQLEVDNSSPSQLQAPPQPFGLTLPEDPFAITRASTPTRQTRSANVTPVKQRKYSTVSAQSTPSSSASKRSSVPVTEGLLVNIGDDNDEDDIVHCSPRVDRLAEKPSVDNAQGLYLPDACVFVANLPRACDDEKLKATVDKVFNEFGTCYTKVHRNPESMPFAHVQYETNAIATNAINFGKGRDIEGRPCRTELSNAKVSLFVSSINGKKINSAEVLEILRHYGDIVANWSPTQTEYTFNKLPLGGMFFRFAFFLDCVDALQSLRSHPKYRFESRVEPQAQQAQRLATRRSLSAQASPAPRRQMSVESRMPGKVVLVSNLPLETTYRTLTAIFGLYGTITACTVTVQLPPNGAQATVEYSAASSAVAAVENQDGKSHTITGDRKLRVMFHSSGHSSHRPVSSPSQKHGQRTWSMQDLNRSQAPPSIQAYTPHMTPYPTPVSYYTLSAPNEPVSPASIGYASQYYNMGVHGSANVFGYPQSYQLAESR